MIRLLADLVWRSVSAPRLSRSDGGSPPERPAGRIPESPSRRDPNSLGHLPPAAEPLGEPLLISLATLAHRCAYPDPNQKEKTP
jgi:hypothetical protein